MAAMAGLLNQPRGGSASPFASSAGAAGANAAAPGNAATSGTEDASSSSATISANDFLTLLVTELQNQDPTAATDPNEYINQLVQVNSLEQLISINQNLSTVLGTAGTTPTGSTVASHVSTPPSAPGASLAPAQTASAAEGGAPPAQPGGPGLTSAISQFARSAGGREAPGNLNLPAADPAAHQVARALDGHGNEHSGASARRPAIWNAAGRLPGGR
jgi:flagellar basal-body rod modification protein FlgD